MPDTRDMSRLEHLDGLRAVLALWVVGNHAWLTIYPTVGASNNPHGLLGLVTNWMVYGHFAVVAFIVVSGYSLAISTTANGARLRGGFGTFLRRRFTRIVLPYWGALALSLALATTVISSDTGTHWDAALPVTGTGVVLHALLLQDFSGTGQINHALWSIALEWHIYFVFPLILLLRRRFGLLYATVGVMAAGLFVSALHNGGLTLWDEANFFGCFALGVAARELAMRVSRVPWDVLAGLLLIGFVVVSGVLGTVRASGGSNTLLEPLFGLGVAALLLALSQDRTAWLRRGLSWRPLAGIGAYSYSLYLLHAPVLQLVWQYVLRPLGLPLHDGWVLGWLLALGVPASLVVGWTYFCVVERPCMTLGRRSPSPVPRKVLVGVET
ncbi:hypothetical protein acdb102_27870 [Acidothermaceae bacterium B102]|nr:hypothetical protein acdb102_27870 [Acidothermaceae bacterium B102]